MPNSIYEFVPEAKRFRLMVVFEHAKDRAQFMTGQWDVIPDTERSIWEIFHRCLPDRAHDRAFLIIKAFDTIARAECAGLIPKERLNLLKSEFTAHGMWEISRFGAMTTFFFETEEQLSASATNGLRAMIKESYFPVEKEYDEFGYLTVENHHVAFDSRENFEKKFKGNWYYYYQ